ncbi:MAG: hypothetical protein C5B47_08325 [Verrucomicrobia bacterium]|nr:MAG: hypothetical protein C5B47_08325 [Verrucomicrobiota bacterium]
MAHERRKIIDLLKIDPKNEEALEVVKIIAELYAKENQVREAKLNYGKRRTLRREQSRS